jgi:hypothetical protein
MTVAKMKPVTTLLAVLSVLGAGVLTYRLLAVEPQQEEAKKPAQGADKGAAAANAEAFARLQLEMTQRELIQVQADLRKNRLDLKFWSAREETFTKLPIPNSAVEERLNQDPMVGKYLLRLSELRDQIVQAERVAKDGKNSPEVKDYQNQIMATEKTLETLRKTLQPQIVAQLREKVIDEYKGKLIQLKEQIDFNEELEKTLKAEVQRFSEGVRAAPLGGDQRLSLLEKEVRELKAAVEELKKKK